MFTFQKSLWQFVILTKNFFSWAFHKIALAILCRQFRGSVSLGPQPQPLEFVAGWLPSAPLHCLTQSYNLKIFTITPPSTPSTVERKFEDSQSFKTSLSVTIEGFHDSPETLFSTKILLILQIKFYVKWQIMSNY